MRPHLLASSRLAVSTALLVLIASSGACADAPDPASVSRTSAPTSSAPTPSAPTPSADGAPGAADPRAGADQPIAPPPDGREAQAWRAEQPTLPEMLFMAGAAKQTLEALEISGSAVLLDARTGERIVQVDHEAKAPLPTQPWSPGSSIKPLLVANALRLGAIQDDLRVACDGHYEVDGQVMSCFSSHGELDLAGALATSCNEYAYEVARLLGAPALLRSLQGFGFGQDSGSLPAPPGPDDADVWAVTEGVGHGELRVTPAQLATAYADHLAPPGDPAREAVVAGMIAAVEDERGTATAAAVPGLRVAAKTGTTEGSTEGLYDSWLVAMAPAERPDVVLVVFVHDGPVASQIAAPAAGQILAAWSERQAALTDQAATQSL
ncbi:hypothetical protein G6O69_12595 [Pseudenhygromyxa sp. WMMC2535]|uniref:penicillin-binding transpeptidase domain-containing protein n=1 Tax=Pseudenhygromyxa sp. WMMC2535 TaxID=2712867 RepID=UPI001556AC5B|nr:penicillin-binding transpeptidase domain-containing protein [Pseudenhygromyxa sp. WMMC2535]NVB38672.1 hypothetical protein [Pseudenhygromyxa sp. WMMC2535]